MSRIQSTPSTTASSGTAATGASGKKSSGIEDLDLSSFFDLMIAELQNQDPLNPMDNQEMLAQIGQLRQISSNDKLSETLDSVLLGQSISSATNLIGANVKGLTDTGQKVSGDVQRVTIDKGEPLLDLAVKTGAFAGDKKGEIDEGEYRYQVVWDDKTGNQYGVVVDADTKSFEKFQGSISLENLPETDGAKRVYRSSKDGKGPMRLVGTISQGRQTSFEDESNDLQRQTAVLNGQVTTLATANKVTVRLKNIGEINPPE